MEITDMNEAEVESMRYDPYGTMTITVGGTPQSSDVLGQYWGFTGRFFDEECGLCYCRARAYIESLGRFAQRDRLGQRAGPNLYTYASASPPCRVDPLGLRDSADPPEGARLAAGSALDAAKYDMGWCAGESTSPENCQECCGFAAWDAMAALGAATVALCKECAEAFPKEKKEAEELGVDASAITNGLEVFENVEKAAELLGGAAEAAVAGEQGAGAAAGFSMGYNVAGAGVAIQAAESLLNVLAKHRADELDALKNPYIGCLKQGAAYVSHAMSRLQDMYEDCMASCRGRWGKNCDRITPTKKAWRWLRTNNDYRTYR
jgi:RHS repeat-associated protein